jgi:tRNA(Ile)-lysidine synthase
LKNLLQEFDIPPWRRERLPLLYCGEDLVCVPGVAIAAAYRATENEAAILVALTAR